VHYPDLGSASDWLKEKALTPQLSSVWNFCVRYSDVVLRGHKWPPRKTLAVFSGYQQCGSHLQSEVKSALSNDGIIMF